LLILLSGDFTVTYPNSTTQSYRVDACSLDGYGTVGSPWLVESEADHDIAGVTETLAAPPAANSSDDLNSNGYIDSCPDSGEYLRTWSPDDDDESDDDGSGANGSGEVAPGVVSNSLPATGLESSEGPMLLAIAGALTLGGVLLVRESRRRSWGSRTDR
jgi:LPXTG-motif cell wall-anchored protein